MRKQDLAERLGEGVIIVCFVITGAAGLLVIKRKFFKITDK